MKDETKTISEMTREELIDLIKNIKSHNYIYGLIRRESNGGFIHISQIHPVIKWYIRLPKKYQHDFIQELITFELLKKVGRDNFEVLPLNHSPPIDSHGNPLWNFLSLF